LREFLTELNEEEWVKEPITIYSNNQAMIAVANKCEVSKRTKHIMAKYHYTQDEVKKGNLAFKYIPSQDNVANLLTKSLDQATIDRLLIKAGMEWDDADERSSLPKKPSPLGSDVASEGVLEGSTSGPSKAR
jgi:hypothetical protein